MNDEIVFKSEFFQEINTREKAYWLGFLYADGNISIDKRRRDSKRLSIHIGRDDEILIDRFANAVGINLKYKRFEERYNTYMFQVGNKKVKPLIEDLIEKGVVIKKSNIIELPHLNSRELYLAFLLGFFDGDGKKGSTRITSGSKRFLEQIKERFNLEFVISKKKSKGIGYDLYLGAELFNEMMENYSFSLLKKRRKFSTKKERINKIRESAWKKGSQIKFKIKKEKLENLVWTMPSVEIAKNYGVSDSLITKRCKEWGIDKPPRGYWSKKRSKNKDNLN